MPQNRGPNRILAANSTCSHVSPKVSVTSAASPGSVMVTESTRGMVADAAGFEWAPAGTRQFKGVREAVKLFRISRV
jgi:adenylate cyclase